MVLDSTITYKITIYNYHIEDVVAFFNEQLVPQIQKLYEPGGKWYLESENKIERHFETILSLIRHNFIQEQ